MLPAQLRALVMLVVIPRGSVFYIVTSAFSLT